MDNCIEFLRQHLSQLQKLSGELKTALNNVPPGHLRLAPGKGTSYYYYQRFPASTDSPVKNKYLAHDNSTLIKSLAQKDYDMQLDNMITDQILCLQRFLANYQPDLPNYMYDRIHPERRRLITPRLLPDTLYIEQWQNQTYDKKGFRPGATEIYSDKGERVRSKSEKILADYFLHNNIPYHYEYPIQLSEYGTVYPDFTLLNVRLRKTIYWEHFGMMDEPEYVQKTVKKINSYICNGIMPGRDMIFTYETKFCPLNTNVLDQLTRCYLL